MSDGVQSIAAVARDGHRKLSAHAVIQAGGRGERLRPLTLETPKPLLAVDGMPMVERLVRQLAAAGLRRFTILTSWLGDQVREYLRGLVGLPDGVEIDFAAEEWGLGTVGGLAALPPSDATVLLVFGDLVTTMDFARLLAVHDAAEAGLTLASHVERYRVRLGEIVSSGSEVMGYLEKPEKEFLICSGVAALSPAVVELIGGLVPPVGLGAVVNAAVENGQRVTHWRHGALWFDVNDPAEMDRASTAIRARD